MTFFFKKHFYGDHFSHNYKSYSMSSVYKCILLNWCFIKY